jgi:glyoxylase-like metal-dependent hydrolase (beta-lactamase superfamily II)
MSLLLEGTPADPLVVVRSRLWQFNAIGLFDGDEALVIDPGIDPDEIAQLTERVTTAHNSGPPRRVTWVLLTHSHHDHIRGWARFPGAKVAMPRMAAEKGPQARERILAAKAKLDQSLGVEDPDFAYPRASRVFEDRLALRCGRLEVELRFLPGHSDCTSVVWIPALATLCSADYLVSPGLPYCRWQARAFDEALATLESWVVTEGVQRIVPAHRDLHVGPEAVRAALARDQEYMARLRVQVRTALDQGLTPDRAARAAAREMAKWRGADLGPRTRQDVDNAQRVASEY